MRRALIAAVTIIVGLFGLPAVANAGTYAFVICMPIYGPVDSIIGWDCFSVDTVTPTAPDPGCPQCAPAFDFHYGDLPPDASGRVTSDIKAGIEQLGAAAVATDPNQAQQIHTAALNDFLQAGRDLAGHQLNSPSSYLVYPTGSICCGDQPIQPAADGFSQGISLVEQLLASQDPALWDAIVPMFDKAYAELAQGAAG